MRAVLSALVLALALAGAQAQPVVPGATAASSATVPDPRALSIRADGALYSGRDATGSGGSHADAVKIYSVAPGDACHALDGAAAWPTNNHAQWVYGSTPGLGGSFSPFLEGNTLGDYYSMNAYRYSQAAFPADYPIIAFNKTAKPLTFGSGQFQVPGQTVDMVPGADGAYAVARFLVPGSGPHHLSGEFLGLEAAFSDVPATRTDVHVLHNSTNRLFNELVIGQFTGQRFDLIVQLNAGDTVDFAVGYGSGFRGNLGDSTGLTATIVLMPVLRIAPGNPLELSWPTNATGFFLESVTNLPPSIAWARFGETPTVVGANFVVRTTGLDSQRFFRLVK